MSKGARYDVISVVSCIMAIFTLPFNIQIDVSIGLFLIAIISAIGVLFMDDEEETI
jgi:hypothetical protein